MLTYLGLILSVDVEKLWQYMILCLSLLQKHFFTSSRYRSVLHEQFITYRTARGIKSIFSGAIIDNNFLYTKTILRAKVSWANIRVEFQSTFQSCTCAVLTFFCESIRCCRQ